MQPTVVDRLYNEFKTLIGFLEAGQEISLRSTADENLRKSLLMAAASYFERKICEDIAAFADETSGNNGLIVEFIKNKAISRQYHTFFGWDGNNANPFFGLFGDLFKTFMRDELKKNGQLEDAIKAFLEIGRERNRLVHQDFGTFPLEKTSEEIYGLYKKAIPFIEAIPQHLRHCLANSRQNQTP